MPETVLKGWGSEFIHCNIPLYCGKLLRFNAGKKCSYHYHVLKTETFYLHSGKLRIIFSFHDDKSVAEEKTLIPGDTFHIPPGLRHQMIALEDSELFETSTQHFDSDSYRIEKGD